MRRRTWVMLAERALALLVPIAAGIARGRCGHLAL